MNGTERPSYQEFESLPARVAATLRSPRALFESVIARPRWLAVLLATTAVMVLCSAGFLATERGRQALVDQWERTAVAFGQEVDDDRYEEFVRASAYGPAYGAATALMSGPGLTLAVAAAVFAWPWRPRPGRVRFAQVFALAAHAGVILALRQVVALPFNIARETLASPTTAGALFPMLDEMSPAARFLGLLDVFVIWWVAVLALGVSMLYGRPTRSVVGAFASAYLALALLLALAMAVSGGTA